MVSTTFQRDSALSIALPEASTEATSVTERPIEVSVDVQGRYYVNGVQLVNRSPDTLRLALKHAAEGRDAPQVIINADAKATVQANDHSHGCGPATRFSQSHFSDSADGREHR